MNLTRAFILLCVIYCITFLGVSEGRRMRRNNRRGNLLVVNNARMRVHRRQKRDEGASKGLITSAPDRVSTVASDILLSTADDVHVEMPPPTSRRKTQRRPGLNPRSMVVSEYQPAQEPSQAPGQNGTYGVADFMTLDRNSQLHKLMEESSQLSNELKAVFEVLSKRENKLVNDMGKLKSSLGEAISTMNEGDVEIQGVQPYSPSGSQAGQAGNANTSDLPYKACVSIETEAELEPTDQFNDGLQYPPNANIREFIPDKPGLPDEEATDYYEYVEEEVKVPDESTIDLSKVYWMQLPHAIDDDNIKTKIHGVFSEVTKSGMDVLIIPVPRGFKSAHEVSQGFLNAIVQPAVKRSKRSNRLARLLNLHIKEV